MVSSSWRGCLQIFALWFSIWCHYFQRSEDGLLILCHDRHHDRLSPLSPGMECSHSGFCGKKKRKEGVCWRLGADDTSSDSLSNVTKWQFHDVWCWVRRHQESHLHLTVWLLSLKVQAEANAIKIIICITYNNKYIVYHMTMARPTSKEHGGHDHRCLKWGQLLHRQTQSLKDLK